MEVRDTMSNSEPGWRLVRTSLTAVAIAISLVLSGCGYTLRAPFDREIKTVFVPIFKSNSFRREVNLQLTEMVQKEIEQRAGYKVVSSPDEADTILSGTINFADKNLVVESPFNLPRELSAMMNVTVKWTHNPPTEAERNRPPTLISETVNFVTEVGESTETAFYRVNQSLARQIVDMMEVPWYSEEDFK
jgi:hypothetical protein